MKKIFFGATTFILLALSDKASAQYDYYASLFGRQTMNGGTARYTAIGGAGTALGADLGSAYVNPAGLGMYRKSEFSFSPNFGFAGSNSTFIDNTGTRDFKQSFNISSLGIAICGKKDDLDKSDWRGGTFTLSMSRTNNFHNRISFSGADGQSSYTDKFVELANGTPSDSLAAQYDSNNSLAALAYNTYLIDATSPHGSTYTNYKEAEVFNKDATYTTKGGQVQWNIGYGTNYKDKLYIGGVFGINSINFKEALAYSETVDPSFNASGTTLMFDNMTFNDYNTIKGTGVNLKLGYIYKITDAIRIGTTVTTPTYYWMNQQYYSDLSATFPSNIPLSPQSQSTTTGYFKFNYTTPVKIASGMSIVAGKAGFISGDLEYIPYQLSDISGRNNADTKFLNPYNKIISSTYKPVVNLRLGGELRLDIFRLRGGLAYLPNPYTYTDHVNRNIAQYSIGAGVRLDDFYIDLGIVNSKSQSSYQPYSLSNTKDLSTGEYITAPTAISKNSLTNVVLTMGFYFE